MASEDPNCTIVIARGKRLWAAGSKMTMSAWDVLSCGGTSTSKVLRPGKRTARGWELLIFAIWGHVAQVERAIPLACLVT
eukprot:3469111-Amphidinium_carterae.3